MAMNSKTAITTGEELVKAWQQEGDTAFLRATQQAQYEACRAQGVSHDIAVRVFGLKPDKPSP